MNTQHQIITGDARDLDGLRDASVQLVVTSPPYPMVAMWDDIFRDMAPDAGKALDEEDGLGAFEAMHQELDKAWAACFRVVAPGGFACINVGDATRSIGGMFRLFSNHARIVSSMMEAGFTTLPDILWRKPTNAPNKFMGSGMLPAGAYVTYEHEYILVFRKGGKRIFASDEARAERSRSAYFWEERNEWFSDVWEGLTGTEQRMSSTVERERSGAFPFALPYRLINMYSVYGDVVLDPFAGTGTTQAAAVIAGRSSIGVEQSTALTDTIRDRIVGAVETGEQQARGRLAAHMDFVSRHRAAGKSLKHHNTVHDVPVVTRQEATLCLTAPSALTSCEQDTFKVTHTTVETASVTPALQVEPGSATGDRLQ